MVPLTSLVIPILLSAVIVSVASVILHMVLTYHRSDLRRLPKEDEPPGDYGAPHPGSPAPMKKPQFIEKTTKGPIVVMTITPGRAPSMGKNLFQWFLYSVVVSIVAAYIAGRALGPGVDYLEVFRFAGASAAFHLVQADLGNDAEGGVRWLGLRAPDGRNVRMALATVAQGTRTVR